MTSQFDSCRWGTIWTIAIIRYIKNKYNLMIGERTAETRSRDGRIGAYQRIERRGDDGDRGRDLVSGLPKQIEVSATEVCEALSDTVEAILTGVNRRSKDNHRNLRPTSWTAGSS